MTQTQIALENRIDREAVDRTNMTFSSLCKSLVPSVIVGTVAAMGCQEVTSRYCANPEAITLSGMAAQYIGGWTPFLIFHYQQNKHRLKKSDGSLNYRVFSQDLSAVLASDQVSNKVWAGSYALSNELCLRNGIDPAVAGLISGASSGTIYTLFTAYTATKVYTAINLVKEKVKKWRNNKHAS